MTGSAEKRRASGAFLLGGQRRASGALLLDEPRRAEAPPLAGQKRRPAARRIRLPRRVGRLFV
jgi:hypothetical protein